MQVLVPHGMQVMKGQAVSVHHLCQSFSWLVSTAVSGKDITETPP